MYKIIIASLILMISCTKDNTTENSEAKRPQNEYVGTWENKGQWRKWMRMKVILKDKDKFECWFESDRKTKESIRYPIEGTYKIVNSTIILNSDRNEELYSKEYKIIEENGGKLLLSTWQLQNWEKEGRSDCHPLYKTTN